ncbi:MAG TPA: tRNA 4-thiouridine(8) synthase ThiI [Peptococcaceae bacterium]|nr:MAG: putative tRNA sulfurtransferase [Clostridia bacterium 41_269]HBT20127.1 tRNA 4-thiouridine(8) synthase ThiI [Peptococcaceae bacterium]
MSCVILVRYGEIGLKGKNRIYFERMLMDNIRRSLGDLKGIKVSREHGRLYVEHEEDAERVIERLKKVFGIVSVSPARVVPLDMEAIKEGALDEVKEFLKDRGTFKVETKRANKKFPYKSIEINSIVGAHILKNTEDLKVDVNAPLFTVNIEIRENNAYIYSTSYPAPGGLPVGTTGKGGLLISGGIDSPVAGWLAMKRGVEITGIHFYSFPFTSERSKEKVVELCRVLAGYGGPIRLFVVPFTRIQSEIKKNCPEKFYVTIMRRMMFRIAEKICLKEGCTVLFTGENLGQVASQTLESIAVIENVVNIPVLRPLITMDKSEIIEKAKEIGTYDISIQPYEDCCTIFVPKHPATKPKLEEVEKAEEKILGFENLVEEAVEKAESMSITPK